MALIEIDTVYLAIKWVDLSMASPVNVITRLGNNQIADAHGPVPIRGLAMENHLPILERGMAHLFRLGSSIPWLSIYYITLIFTIVYRLWIYYWYYIDIHQVNIHHSNIDILYTILYSLQITSFAQRHIAQGSSWEDLPENCHRCCSEVCWDLVTIRRFFGTNRGEVPRGQ